MMELKIQSTRRYVLVDLTGNEGKIGWSFEKGSQVKIMLDRESYDYLLKAVFSKAIQLTHDPLQPSLNDPSRNYLELTL